MPKHTFTPDQIAHICDYVAEAHDNEEQTRRREKMAEKNHVSVETINAITAHITIRRNTALSRMGEVLRKRNLRLDRAREALAFASESNLSNVNSLRGVVAVRTRKNTETQDGYDAF